MKGLLTQVHNNFIELVKERRPNIDKDHKTVFTGDFFVGETAVKIGLADGTVTDMKSLCRKRFGKDVVFQRCDLPSGLFGKWLKKSMSSETSIQIDDALDSIAVREMQSHYGL
jgi:ClpP class serine protease